MIRKRSTVVQRQLAFWLVIAALFFFLLWKLSGILLPFVLGPAVAFVCDPIVDRLERVGVPRSLATLIVLTFFVGIGVVVLILIAPLLQDQILQLIDRVPHYAEVVRRRLLPALTGLIQRVSGSGDADDVRKAASSYAGNLSSWLVSLLGQVWSGGLAIFNVAWVMLLTPLIAFYFLRDWHRIVAQIDGWLPRRQADTIRGLARDIDAILSGFVRGQATVCLLFAIYYAAALTAAGLNYGLIIGIAAGVLTFIPYLGAITGLVVSVAVALGQFDDYSRVAIVATVYIVGHLIEANFVTPNLVGHRVALHPVWIILGLLAGGALFGFTGVLLAIPAAAVIGVLVRFALKQYLASSFYDDRAV